MSDKVEGVYSLLMSLEANAAMQTEKKTAEKYRQHQITLLQQQITELQDCRDQLKDVVSQLSSSSQSHLDPADLLTSKVAQMTSLQSLLGVAVTAVKQNSVSIEFCTSYLGMSYESYALELSSSDAAPVSVVHHDLPYFVPVQQIVSDCSTVAKEEARRQLVWAVYRYLHAFVARRQETLLAQDSVGEDVICKMCASVAYDVIEIKLSSSQDSTQSVTVHLTYNDLQCCLPSQVALSCDGESVAHDQRAIEFVKKKLMSACLSDSLPFVVRLLTVSG